MPVRNVACHGHSAPSSLKPDIPFLVHEVIGNESCSKEVHVTMLPHAHDGTIWFDQGVRVRADDDRNADEISCEMQVHS